MTENPKAQGGPPSPDPQIAARYVSVSPRRQYRRVRNRRKTIVFGSAILGLLGALAIGALGLTGFLALPFGDEFARTVKYAELGDTPCPTEGARPQSTAGVKLQILNTTSTPGLAGDVAAYFTELGYQIASTDNAPLYRGGALIEAGPRGVDAAYTVARYLGDDVRIRLNQTEDKTVTVMLGEQFSGVPTTEETEQIQATTFALVPQSGCLQVKEPAAGWAVPEQYQSGQPQSEASGQSGNGDAGQPEDEGE